MAGTGLGDMGFAGAVAGYRTFSSYFGNGDTFTYEATDPVTFDYETGLGTFHQSTNTFTRTQVYESSNGNGPVNWAGNPGTSISVQLLAQQAGWVANPSLVSLAPQRLIGNADPTDSGAPAPIGLDGELVLASGVLRTSKLNQAATNHFFASDGAKVQRLNDRVLVGDATKHDGSTLANGDWLSQLMQWPVYGAQMAVTSPVGQIALTLASRTSDLSPSYNSTETTIGLASFAINDATSRALTAYALYLEGRRYAGAKGLTFALELDAINFGDDVQAATPYLPFVGGGNVGIWAASGGGQTGIHDAMIAYAVKANGAKWKTGLLFAADSLTGTDGLTGFGEAIALAKGHVIRWYSSTGGNSSQGAGFITSVSSAGTAPSLQFTDQSVLLVGPDGAPNLALKSGSGMTRYLQLQPASGSTAPGFYSTGPQADVNLGIYPKGNGMIETHAPLQNAASHDGAAGAVPAHAETFMQITVNGSTYVIALFPAS